GQFAADHAGQQQQTDPDHLVGANRPLGKKEGIRHAYCWNVYAAVALPELYIAAGPSSTPTTSRRGAHVLMCAEGDRQAAIIADFGRNGGIFARRDAACRRLARPKRLPANDFIRSEN